jgi:signal peptidase
MTSSRHRRASRLAGLVVAAGLVGVLAVAGTLLATGDRVYVVRSGSMAPAIDTGDAVVVERIAPLDATPGQVVAFPDPDGSGRLLNHRVRSVRPDGDRVKFVTRGDANNVSEHWSVAADGTIGRVLFRVRKLGYVIFWLTTPTARLALWVVPSFLLCAFVLIRIWRPAREVADERPS